jgi:hypothetical protein
VDKGIKYVNPFALRALYGWLLILCFVLALTIADILLALSANIFHGMTVNADVFPVERKT